jgi:short-subunit dehydrogenase
VATEFQSHIGGNTAKKRFKTPVWLELTAEDVARSVVNLARRPRRHLITPWLMVFAKFFNSHFNGASDSIQAETFRPYHHIS